MVPPPSNLISGTLSWIGSANLIAGASDLSSRVRDFLRHPPPTPSHQPPNALLYPLLHLSSGDRLALISINRQIHSILHPLQLCLVWSYGRDSCLADLLTHVQDIIISVCAFIHPYLVNLDVRTHISQQQQQQQRLQNQQQQQECNNNNSLSYSSTTPLTSSSRPPPPRRQFSPLSGGGTSNLYLQAPPPSPATPPDTNNAIRPPSTPPRSLYHQTSPSSPPSSSCLSPSCTSPPLRPSHASQFRTDHQEGPPAVLSPSSPSSPLHLSTSNASTNNNSFTTKLEHQSARMALAFSLLNTAINIIHLHASCNPPQQQQHQYNNNNNYYNNCRNNNDGNNGNSATTADKEEQPPNNNQRGGGCLSASALLKSSRRLVEARTGKTADDNNIARCGGWLFYRIITQTATPTCSICGCVRTPNTNINKTASSSNSAAMFSSTADPLDLHATYRSSSSSPPSSSSSLFNHNSHPSRTSSCPSYPLHTDQSVSDWMLLHNSNSNNSCATTTTLHVHIHPRTFALSLIAEKTAPAVTLSPLTSTCSPSSSPVGYGFSMASGVFIVETPPSSPADGVRRGTAGGGADTGIMGTSAGGSGGADNGGDVDDGDLVYIADPEQIDIAIMGSRGGRAAAAPGNGSAGGQGGHIRTGGEQGAGQGGWVCDDDIGGNQNNHQFRLVCIDNNNNSSAIPIPSPPTSSSFCSTTADPMLLLPSVMSPVLAAAISCCRLCFPISIALHTKLTTEKLLNLPQTPSPHTDHDTSNTKNATGVANESAPKLLQSNRDVLLWSWAIDHHSPDSSYCSSAVSASPSPSPAYPPTENNDSSTVANSSSPETLSSSSPSPASSTPPPAPHVTSRTSGKKSGKKSVSPSKQEQQNPSTTSNTLPPHRVVPPTACAHNWSAPSPVRFVIHYAFVLESKVPPSQPTDINSTHTDSPSVPSGVATAAAGKRSVAACLLGCPSLGGLDFVYFCRLALIDGGRLLAGVDGREVCDGDSGGMLGCGYLSEGHEGMSDEALQQLLSHVYL
eukprot:GHVS01091976.1.p1 GENE.GHVS01091976.1~~GHVS01091976.1.p1  ORF type:complete len:1043 (+),score=293.59 GHVS01091976.1:81-3131(+)